jgi:tetratricopeptide (TPR) repeat protein
MQKAEALEPEHVYLETRKGDLALWQRRFDEAISHYQQSLKKSDNPETYFDLALAQVGHDALAEAEENFKIAIDRAGVSHLRNMKDELKKARKILSESDLLDKIDQQFLDRG